MEARRLIEDPLSSLTSSGFFVVATVTGGRAPCCGRCMGLLQYSTVLHVPRRPPRLGGARRRCACCWSWRFAFLAGCCRKPSLAPPHRPPPSAPPPPAVADVAANGTTGSAPQNVTDESVGASALSRIRAIQSAATGEAAAAQNIKVLGGACSSLEGVWQRGGARPLAQAVGRCCSLCMCGATHGGVLPCCSGALHDATSFPFLASALHPSNHWKPGDADASSFIPVHSSGPPTFRPLPAPQVLWNVCFWSAVFVGGFAVLHGALLLLLRWKQVRPSVRRPSAAGCTRTSHPLQALPCRRPLPANPRLPGPAHPRSAHAFCVCPPHPASCPLHPHRSPPPRCCTCPAWSCSSS